jgi:hypothetical protein
MFVMDVGWMHHAHVAHAKCASFFIESLLFTYVGRLKVIITYRNGCQRGAQDSKRVERRKKKKRHKKRKATHNSRGRRVLYCTYIRPNTQQ